MGVLLSAGEEGVIKMVPIGTLIAAFAVPNDLFRVDPQIKSATVCGKRKILVIQSAAARMFEERSGKHA